VKRRTFTTLLGRRGYLTGRDTSAAAERYAAHRHADSVFAQSDPEGQLVSRRTQHAEGVVCPAQWAAFEIDVLDVGLSQFQRLLF